MTRTICANQENQSIESATVPQARQGVFDPFSGCLMSGFLVFLRGPQPSTRITRSPIFGHFSHYFFRPVFYHNWCQNVPKWEPQKNTKTHKSRKTPHQNAFLIEACKKTPSRRGQTSEFNDCYTLSAVFSEAQGSQKGVENGAKMEPPGTPNHKKSRKVGIQKNIEKQHCKKWVRGRILLSKRDSFFVSKTSLKSQKSEKSAKWAHRPPK